MRFFDVRDGQWFHKRIERELAKAIQITDKKSKAGKSGAYARWHGRGNGSRMTGALANASQPHDTANADAMRGQWQTDAPSPSPLVQRENVEQAELPVELPPGFPATKEDAIVHAAFVGCTPDFAQHTWNKALSRGGRDAQNLLIRNWRAHLATEWKYEQNRIHRDRQHATRQPANKPGADRSVGTANEGKAGDYSGLG